MPKIRTKINRARTSEGKLFKTLLLGFVGLFFWSLIFAVIFRMLLYFRSTQGIGDLLAGKLLGLAFITFLMILILPFDAWSVTFIAAFKIRAGDPGGFF